MRNNIFPIINCITTYEVGGRVAERDVGDELETELTRVEYLEEILVALVQLHAALDHDARAQYVVEENGQDSASYVRLDESDAVGRYEEVGVDVERLEELVGQEERATAETERTLLADRVDAAEAGGEADVVGDYDAGIERLEVEHGYGLRGVEGRLGLHGQRQALGRAHVQLLLLGGRERHVVELARNAQHHRLDPVLGAARQHVIELDAVYL